MPQTYDRIEAKTLGTATASVTFSAIPGTYTDLVLVIQAKSTASYASFRVQVNSDTGTNYSQTVLSGSGTAANSSRLSNNSNFDLCRQSGISSDGFGIYTVNLMNYSNTTTFKTFLDRTNVQNVTAGDGVEAMVGLYRSTNAITSITLTPGAGNLAIGSTLTLYGIKAA